MHKSSFNVTAFINEMQLFMNHKIQLYYKSSIYLQVCTFKLYQVKSHPT